MTDETDNPSRIEAIKAALNARVAEVRTVVPGRVIDYDHDEQRASVRPVIRSKRKDADTGEADSYLPPTIPNCPVAFPSSSNFSITWPLEAGDTVELRFASRSLDEWLTGGGEDVDPKDERRHDISDPIVWPGVRSFANALGSDRIDQSALVVDGDEIHLGKASPDRFVALAKLVEQRLNAIEDYIANQLRNHDHQYAVPLIPIAPGSTSNVPKEPVPSTDEGDTASDKVRSE